MRAHWLNWRQVMLDDPALPFGSKAVGLLLQTYMNDQHDFAFPSMKTICAKLSISNATAVKHVRGLVEAGYISKSKRFGKSTVYSIEFPDSALSSLETELVQDLNHSSLESKPAVVQNLNTNKQENKQYKNNKDLVLDVNGVDPAAWADYDAHRQSTAKLRSTWTDLAKKKAANFLRKLDPEQQAECVDYSIRGGYSGLYHKPTKGKHDEKGERTGSGRYETAGQRAARRLFES